MLQTPVFSRDGIAVVDLVPQISLDESASMRV